MYFVDKKLDFLKYNFGFIICLLIYLYNILNLQMAILFAEMEYYMRLPYADALTHSPYQNNNWFVQ